MGYWTISIEGTGAHGNPNFERDSDRMADEFVKQLKAAGHEVRRAVFLYDYKGEHAGDTLPYHEPKWALSRNEVELATPGPYHVHETIAHQGATPLYEVVHGGRRHAWYAGDGFPGRDGAVQLAERYNRVAAKEAEKQAGLKPIGGGSQANDEPEPSRILVHDDNPAHITKYWDRPADGKVYRARSEYGGDREPFEWDDDYDLDLGSDVYLSWTYGTQEGFDHLPFSERPRTEQPIGCTLFFKDPGSASGWDIGGLTFSSAPGAYREFQQDGQTRQRPTWDVQSWAPLTLTPSILNPGHKTTYGETATRHGFITGGRWIPA